MSKQAPDEVHVAVAQAAEMSRAEMRELVLLKIKHSSHGRLIKLTRRSGASESSSEI